MMPPTKSAKPTSTGIRKSELVHLAVGVPIEKCAVSRVGPHWAADVADGEVLACDAVAILHQRGGPLEEVAAR
jgi:hypothetical protein